MCSIISKSIILEVSQRGGIYTTPMFRSTVAILLFAPGLRSLLDMIFSTARTTPSLHRIPIAVPPFSTAFTAYSTWVFRVQPWP